VGNLPASTAKSSLCSVRPAARAQRRHGGSHATPSPYAADSTHFRNLEPLQKSNLIVHRVPIPMRALRYHGNKDVRLDDVPEPVCKPGWVKIKNGYSGICGSGGSSTSTLTGNRSLLSHHVGPQSLTL
jgi:hypothetical protein